ncbi:ABC transporter substrate-binding protein [Verminephrobacter eiseniae]|uniref:ABC transporter substrate-binding protein n=1 Tax=Verminephrobacter eiseniae TaxID=364317 RepID=UPI00223824B5|nr:ABC transporter substrate-binding protein [Verminephrobacter eiseniae]
MTPWFDRCKGCALAGLLCSAFAGAAAAPAQALEKGLEKELVIATTGGQMEKMLVQHFYAPFSKASGVEVVPAAHELPDQWAKVQAMARGGAMEFDIVTATPPDLVQKKDLLQPIDCARLPSVGANGVKGACTAYGVIRTVGGMQIGYSTEVFKGANQPRTWADFWDTAKFPGPRGLPDTGDREWWVPVAALLADGVAPDKLFPLDLERAYRKLDKLRPSVAVWWKSGDQLQQILRNKEVVMSMGYSGRMISLMNSKVPVAVSWDGAIRDVGYMAIPKGAPHPKAALAYLDYFYAAPPGQHVAFVDAVNYDTGNGKTASLFPPERRAMLATSAENFGKLIVADYEWIGRHRQMLRERWIAWLGR